MTQRLEGHSHLEDPQALMGVLEALHQSMARFDGGKFNGVDGLRSLSLACKGTSELSRECLRTIARNSRPWTPSLAELNHSTLAEMYVSEFYFKVQGTNGKSVERSHEGNDHPSFFDAVQIKGLPLTQTGPGWLDLDRYFQNGSLEDFIAAVHETGDKDLELNDDMSIHMHVKKDHGHVTLIEISIWILKDRAPVFIYGDDTYLTFNLMNLYIVVNRKASSIQKATLMRSDVVLFKKIDIRDLVNIIRSRAGTEREKQATRDYLSKIYTKV